jgi:calcineurin-like phosphoesterase family protein
MVDDIKYGLSKNSLHLLFPLNTQNEFDKIILSNFEKILKISEVTVKEDPTSQKIS